MFNYKLRQDEWEQFWEEVVDAVDDEIWKKQLKEWHKQRVRDCKKRHIRRIVTF